MTKLQKISEEYADLFSADQREVPFPNYVLDEIETAFIAGFKAAREMAIENYGNLPVIGSRGYFHYLCGMGSEEV